MDGGATLAQCVRGRRGREPLAARAAPACPPTYPTHPPLAVTGAVAVAKARLSRCASSQLEWKQLGYLCAYELAWCHAFQHDWRATQAEFAALQEGSSWSRTFYCFMQGVALIQQGRVGDARATFVRVLGLFGAARKLGNKVISAGGYGSSRRCAETLQPACLPAPSLSSRRAVRLAARRRVRRADSPATWRAR